MAFKTLTPKKPSLETMLGVEGTANPDYQKIWNDWFNQWDRWNRDNETINHTALPSSHFWKDAKKALFWTLGQGRAVLKQQHPLSFTNGFIFGFFISGSILIYWSY